MYLLSKIQLRRKKCGAFSTALAPFIISVIFHLAEQNSFGYSIHAIILILLPGISFDKWTITMSHCLM